jgi:hypothetical protein
MIPRLKLNNVYLLCCLFFFFRLNQMTHLNMRIRTTIFGNGNMFDTVLKTLCHEKWALH